MSVYDGWRSVVQDNKMNDIPVVIFCGGEGTRMRGGTLTKKELVEIGGRPIIWHVMRIYSAYGFDRFILPLGYEAQQIRRYFLEYEAMTSDFTVRVGNQREVTYHKQHSHPDWEVSLIDTGLHTDKAGRIARIADYLTADRFCLTYGDGLSDVNISELLEFHGEHGRLGTVTAVKPAHYQYGVMEAESDGLVTRYEQYPSLPFWINGGFMVFEREALHYMAGGDNAEFETGVLQDMIAAKEIMMYEHQGFWRSMDTLKDAIDLQAIWRTGAPWRSW